MNVTRWWRHAAWKLKNLFHSFWTTVEWIGHYSLYLQKLFTFTRPLKPIQLTKPKRLRHIFTHPTHFEITHHAMALNHFKFSFLTKIPRFKIEIYQIARNLHVWWRRTNSVKIELKVLTCPVPVLRSGDYHCPSIFRPPNSDSCLKLSAHH